MQFNSYFFILCFLPASVIGYYLLNRIHSTIGLIYLLCMSLWFYGYFNLYYLFLMIGSIIVNFLLSKLIRSFDKRIKKIWLILGVAFNIGVIFCFKYYDFFISNLNYVFQTNFNLKHILLPLGISFLLFSNYHISLTLIREKLRRGSIGFLNMPYMLRSFRSLWQGRLFCMMN